MKKIKLSKNKIKELEKSGYKVKPVVVRHTFHISEILLTTFLEVCDKKGVYYREGLDEAIEDWLKKKGVTF